jgi:hypothetical protein
LNTQDIEDYEYVPTLGDYIAVSKVLAYDLKQLKKVLLSDDISWIEELGKKIKQKYWPEECVYWNSAKVQVVKSKEDAEKAWGYNRRRVITKFPYFVSGLFGMVSRTMVKKDDFVSENIDPVLRYEYFHTIADYVDDHRVKVEDDLNIDYVNNFLNYLISFTENFYNIKPLVEEKLFKSFSTNEFKNYYFAYGSNMDPRQMQQRCPGAIPVGIGNLPFYKTIINSRGVASIINSPDNFASGILWAVSDNHLKTLDKKEGVKLGIYSKEVKTIRIKNLEIHSIVYIATNNEIGKPRDGYLGKLLFGVNHFNLGDNYSSYLQSLK